METTTTLLGLQFFAEPADTQTDTADSTDTKADTAETDTKQEEDNLDKSTSDTERLDKLIQSKVDRALAEERKKNVILQKKYDTLSKEKLSDEEIKKLEIDEREQLLKDKEKELADRENRLHAIKAVKAAGLDDGSDTVLELIDFVMAEKTEDIDARVKTFQALIQRMVAAEVGKTFKDNGRNPGAGKGAGGDKDVSMAEKLGLQTAKSNEQAQNVLNHYLGVK